MTTIDRWVTKLCDGKLLPSLMMRVLWAAAALGITLLGTGLLWIALHVLSDENGAAVVKGIFVAVAAGWCLNFVFLVLLVTIGQLKQWNQPDF